MSRVMVTGASGFIGSQVLPLLAAAGHEVHAVARRSPARTGPPGVTWHEIDLLDCASSEALVEGVRPALLLHLAWYAEHGRFWSSPENLRWVEATLALLRAFAAADGARAVIAGTCAEYDWSALGDGGVCDERTTPLHPATLYGTAKHATHLIAERFAELAGFELAWGRVFFLYGPGEQQGRVVPAVVSSLLAGSPAQTSDGSQVRDFLHVEDVAGGFAALLDSEVTGAVNIASGEGVALRSVIAQIGELVGRPELLEWGAVERPAGDPDVLVGAATRLRDEVGFAPSVGLEQGLAGTIEWWREQLGG